MNDHSRDYVPCLKRYKVVQIYYRVIICMLYHFNMKNYYDFLKSKVDPNIVPMSRVCHHRFPQLFIPPHFSTQIIRTCVMTLLVPA